MGTKANDVLLKASTNTKELIEYKEVSTWWDGSAMDDSKISELYPKLGSKYYRDQSVVIDVKRHCGAKGDYSIESNTGTDDTAAFNKALAMMAQVFWIAQNGPTDGFKYNITINIPPGRYLITDTLTWPLIAHTRPRFQGNYRENTTIYFKPSADKFLIDNDDMFGYALFQDLTFIFATNGKFMRLYAAPRSAAQTFTFDRCRFQNPKQVLKAEGSTMTSEITFRDSKIIGGQAEQVIFHLNNAMATNWKLINTDAESYTGTLIYLQKGSGIYWLSGSIILNSDDAKVVVIDSSSTDSNFTITNGIHISFVDIRYEMHGKCQLFVNESGQARIAISWQRCGFDSLNRVVDNVPFMRLNGFGKFVFDNCYSFGTWNVSHNPYGGEYTAQQYSPEDYTCQMIFINNGPSLRNVKDNATCSSISMLETASLPTYTWINCNGYSNSLKPLHGTNQYSGICGILQASKPVQTIGGFSSWIREISALLEVGTPLPDWIIDTSRISSEGFAYEMRLCLLKNYPDYPGYEFTVTCYSDLTKTRLVGSGPYSSDYGAVIKISEGIPFESLQLVVVMTPSVVGWDSSKFRFQWHIIYI